MLLFTFFLFLFCSLSSMDNQEYNIWVHGSRHPKYLLLDQMYSLGSYFRRCGLDKNGDYQYKGYFSNYRIENPMSSKINYFSWWVSASDSGGRLSANARKEAGKALFEMLSNIFKKNNNAQFNIYGCSHGGNVIAELIEEIRLKNSDLLLNEVYFLDTPKTEWTEKAIHRKNSTGKYIAKNVYNVFPKKRAGFPWHLFDWTASFPYCAQSFLFGRKDLFDVSIVSEHQVNHAFFSVVHYFLEKSGNKVNQAEDLKKGIGEKIPKKCSKNPFRWMLYYRKYIYLALFIAAVQKYVKERKNKYEFRIVMR